MIDTTQQPGHTRHLSLDTDTILKNADINESMTSDAHHGKNALPLPQPLPERIQITEAYLKQFKNQQNFQVYRVTCDFFPLEKRHLGVSKDEIISGFTEENGWICAFKDISPNHFGFVPKGYLKFEHRTNSQSVTPRSELGKSQMNQSLEGAGEKVRDFLGDIYSAANDGQE